jgi:DNA-binding MarR family transcriptional regulator
VCESEYATDVMFGEGSPDQPKRWRALQRGLAHLNRRAEVSTAVNQRYLLALASVDEHTPLAQRVTPLCRPCRRNGRRYRALNPWSPTDAALLEALNRGEFALNGLRNRDLRACLFASPADPAEQRRRTARISRSLALLRAHGLLRKVPHRHRYHLTPKGRTVITALLTARQADTAKLTAMAA